jgi:16S rRNA processing protein RimM
LKGEVQVMLTSGLDARLAPGSVLEGGGEELIVATARRHQARWLVRFDGIEDRTAAEALRGVVLTTEADDDDPGSADLVGREVVERDGTSHGPVAAVQANPAHDLLVLADGTLVPIVFVVDDSDPARLVVDVPEGIFE